MNCSKEKISFKDAMLLKITVEVGYLLVALASLQWTEWDSCMLEFIWWWRENKFMYLGDLYTISIQKMYTNLLHCT